MAHPLTKPASLLKAAPSPWVIVALATLAQAGPGWIVQGVPVLYPFIQADWGLSRAQVGLITSAVMAGSLLTGLPGGLLADRLGVRRVVTGALALLAFLFVGFSAATALWMALALSFLAGMSNSPLYPATSKAVMDWVPQRSRGLGMGIKQTGAMLAGVVAAAILPAVATAYSWRIGILVIVAMVLLTSLVFGTFYREKPRANGERHATAGGSVFAIFKDRSLIALTVWGTVLMALQFVVISHMALFLVQEVQMSAVAAGGLVSVVLLASSGGRVAWGAISDAILGGRHLIALVALGIAASIAAAATGFVTVETPFVMLTLLVIALGATAMGWIALFTVVVAEVAGAERSGTALGTVNTVLRIGMVSSPPLFGLLVDMSGSYTLAWGAAAGVAFISTLALPVFARKRSTATG